MQLSYTALDSKFNPEVDFSFSHLFNLKKMKFSEFCCNTRSAKGILKNLLNILGIILPHFVFISKLFGEESSRWILLTLIRN